MTKQERLEQILNSSEAIERRDWLLEQAAESESPDDFLVLVVAAIDDGEDLEDAVALATEFLPQWLEEQN